MALQEVVPGLYSDTCLCLSSSHDAYQVVNMKAEEDLNTEVVEEPLPMLFAGRKSELKVSFVPLCSLLDSLLKYSE
jgi:hypothetical protein